MRRNAVAATLLLLWTGSVGGAETVIGSLTSHGQVSLRGVTLPMAGVPAWPVVAGDTIETGLFPATIFLKDGTRLALGEKTKVVVDQLEAGLWVGLAVGNLEYRSAARSRTTISAEGKAVDLSGGTVFTGSQSLNPPPAPKKKPEAGTFVPPRAREPMATTPPPGLPPRSPSSPCAADPQAVPPRSPCSQGQGPPLRSRNTQTKKVDLQDR